MPVLWSPHAEELLYDIVIGIAKALSPADGIRWECRLRQDAAQLADFPLLGTSIPSTCLQMIPDNADRLRQIICNPYRIVYEPGEEEIHILSIRHTRMLIAEGDTSWH